MEPLADAGSVTPVNGTSPSPPANEEKRMTLIQHLEELRRVLIISLVAWAIASVAGLIASHWIVQLLTKPLDYLNLRPVVLSPVGVLTIHLKVGLVAGFVLALPIILQQAWTFVAPGLKATERRLAGPLLVSSLTLFALGSVLAYLFMYIGIRLLAPTLKFFGFEYIPVIDEYLGVVVVMILAFGITFEFPVALVLLSLLGIINSERLRRTRRGAYFTIAAVGYVITPGVDPVTPLALIIPLLLLYEGSILVIRRMGK
jgi:sec-independent protein translocase protein TatC